MITTLSERALCRAVKRSDSTREELVCVVVVGCEYYYSILSKVACRERKGQNMFKNVNARVCCRVCTVYM